MPPPYSVPKSVLNTGAEIPLLGLGTWYSNRRLFAYLRRANKGEVQKAVKDALDVGYTHIDCAHVYANEDEIGQAIKDRGCDRKNLFITSKVFVSGGAITN
jgi:diketogulonate reductase-like aldo/keto reductase